MARHHRDISNCLAGIESGSLVSKYFQEYRSGDFNRNHRVLCFVDHFQCDVSLNAEMGMAQVESVKHDEFTATTLKRFGS